MKKHLSAEELDQKFDNGEDITEYLDFDSACPVNAKLAPSTPAQEHISA